MLENEAINVTTIEHIARELSIYFAQCNKYPNTASQHQVPIENILNKYVFLTPHEMNMLNEQLRRADLEIEALNREIEGGAE